MESKCDLCGKNYIKSAGHVYKRYWKRKWYIVCSYGCFCELSYVFGEKNREK